MGDQVKKISFGFSKLAKKTAIVSTHVNNTKQNDEVSKVEFIDCLEGKSIKLKDPVKLDQGPLIIPLTRNKEVKNSHHQLNSENKATEDISKGSQNKPTVESSETCKEENDKKHIKDERNENNDQMKHETLDEIAAREILEELNRKKTEDEEKRVFSVPLTSNAPLGEKESTLDDYDNVPVGEFGMAMLRGMGWAPGKGIGKNEKLVAPSLPAPRPKGMGLGADKVIKPAEKKGSNDEIKMVKGSHIRIIAGPEKDAYGQIEGFDDESGRLIVKLALKNVSISLNEFMVQLVDANEYKKNSKVINVSKYEKYKEDEVKKGSSGKKSQEKLQDNDRKPKSSCMSETIKINHSSESEEENVKDGRSNDFSNSKESSRLKHKTSPSRSSRSPTNRLKDRPKSQSKDNKHQSTINEASSKYSKKETTHRDNRKNRSYSSESSSSSNSYRKANKIKSKSSKAKDYVKNRSISRRRSSSNSFSSDSSANYSREKKNRLKNKKSSSNKYRSRSRSRSPRKHKHKKSKRSH